VKGLTSYSRPWDHISKLA